MDDLEFIKELDDRIDLVTEQWSNELLEVMNNESIVEGSYTYESKCNKINKKYGPLLSKIITMRNEAFDREAKKQNEQYADKFEEVKKEESFLDENGRPRDRYWKNGQWHFYKKNKDSENN